MADGYLEKRYDEVFGQGKKVVKHVGKSLDTLLEKNRSCRGYQKDYIVKRDMLERIVKVNTKIASACNQQVLRFKLITREDGADRMLQYIRLGAALPELHLPFAGTEPEAFIVVCSCAPETRMVDIDLGISLQSMLLKAVDMGLNGIIIGAFSKEKIKAEFGLPFDPMAVLAIGKSAEKYRLVTVGKDDSRAYYREEGVHVVPKVSVDDLIL